MAKCTHDIAEMDTACADGMCPICNAAEIERLRAALRLIDDYYQAGGDLKSHMAHIAQDALAE